MAITPPELQNLQSDWRGYTEDRLGADLSAVRTHSSSSSSSAALSAQAYTAGSDIHFRGGQSAGTSSSGNALIAHELTHVVQQGSAGGFERPR